MRKTITFLAMFAAVLGLGVAVAYASIPGPDGVIHGCRKNSDGSLRVIDSTATCPNGYTVLNWQQGGITGYEIVTSTAVNPTPVLTGVEHQITLSATCPAGKSPLGGGGAITWTSGDAAQYMSNSAPTSNGWSVAWLGNPQLGGESGDYTARVYVICAVVS